MHRSVAYLANSSSILPSGRSVLKTGGFWSRGLESHCDGVSLISFKDSGKSLGPLGGSGLASGFEPLDPILSV